MVKSDTRRKSANPAATLAFYLFASLTLFFQFPSPTSSAEKEAPLTQEQTFKMIQAGVPTQQIEKFARDDGIDFKMTPALERDLRKAGAHEHLILLLKKLSAAQATAPPATPSTSPENSSLLKRADDALTRKDYPEAVKALKAIIATQPGFGAGLVRPGFCL